VCFLQTRKGRKGLLGGGERERKTSLSLSPLPQAIPSNSLSQPREQENRPEGYAFLHLSSADLRLLLLHLLGGDAGRGVGGEVAILALLLLVVLLFSHSLLEVM